MKKEIIILVLIFLIVISVILIFEENTISLNKSKYNNINSINIKADIVDIEIIRTYDKEIKLYIDGQKDDKLAIKEEDNTLYIEKKYSKRVCFIRCNNKITIYVPENFNNISIEHKQGNIIIRPKIKNLLINGVSANIEIKEVSVVNIEYIDGDLIIDKISSEGNSKIVTTRGNINISKVENSKVEITKNNNKKILYEEKENILEIITKFSKVRVG